MPSQARALRQLGHYSPVFPSKPVIIGITQQLESNIALGSILIFGSGRDGVQISVLVFRTGLRPKIKPAREKS